VTVFEIDFAKCNVRRVMGRLDHYSQTNDKMEKYFHRRVFIGGSTEGSIHWSTSFTTIFIRPHRSLN